MRVRLLILAALAIAAGATAVAPASARSSAEPVAVLEDCRERAVLVPGVDELVRQRVPAQFELQRDGRGRPLLGVVGSRCERYTVAGTTRPTSFGFFVAVIKSPDGEGCLSRVPILGLLKPDLIPLCNFYGLFAVYNNPAIPAAVLEVIPDFPIYYVPGIAFEQGSFDLLRLGVPWHYQAPPPTPSPFEIDAIVRDQPLGIPALINFWFESALGTVKFRFEVSGFRPGQMSARLRAAPGSEMAELFGSETPRPNRALAIRYRRAELAPPTFLPLAP